MTYWNHCCAVCLLPWQRRLFHLYLSPSDSPSFFTSPPHHREVTWLCWRQAGEAGIQSVRGSDQFVLLALLFRRGDAACLSLGVSAVTVSRSIFSSPLLFSLSVPPSSVLICSSLLFFFIPACCVASCNCCFHKLLEGKTRVMDCWTAGSLAVNWGKPSAFLSLFIVCFSSDEVLPEGCAWCSMHGEFSVEWSCLWREVPQEFADFFLIFTSTNSTINVKNCSWCFLLVYSSWGGGVSWCLAPSGMHAKRTEGVHSLPCVLFAGVGGDGRLHMAFPASVANVRGSRVGWDSAARE